MTPIRLVIDRAEDSGMVRVGAFDVPQAPEVKEMIKVGGDRYIVFSRSWSVNHEGGQLFCFLTVVYL